MKTISKYLPLLLLCTFFTLSSCTKKEKDSTEIAEDKNEVKFEDTDIENDTEFAVAAADDSMLEVDLGKLAQSKGSSESVKMFGETMVTEHTKVIEELKALALQKNISLPTALSENSQKTYNNLSEKMGKDFDEAYTDVMVKGHKDAVDRFKKEADKGDDQELKSWAAGKVAALEHHLDMAKKVEDVADSLKRQ